LKNICISNRSPIFIVGLPRSGSTLLSKILNNTTDIISVNDLYFMQAVFSLNAITDVLSSEHAQQLLNYILKTVNIRSQKNDDFIGQLCISEDEIDLIRHKILNIHKQNPLSWAQLFCETMDEIAKSTGKSRWADKTPQNFFHLDLLFKTFPESQFIFLFRDPRMILSSYKFASGEGHDKRRYHPVIYSFYWRTAVRSYLKVSNRKQVLMLRYEDIIGNPNATLIALENFLGTTISTINLAELGNNSSFSGKTRKAISESEKWLCEKICKYEMLHLGYKPSQSTFKKSDILELTLLSGKFLLFQTKRFLLNQDARQRILSFIYRIHSIQPKLDK